MIDDRTASLAAGALAETVELVVLLNAVEHCSQYWQLNHPSQTARIEWGISHDPAHTEPIIWLASGWFVLKTGSNLGRPLRALVTSRLLPFLHKNRFKLSSLSPQSKNKYRVAIALVMLYIFLQTFIIPGSIFINLLAGSLYSFGTALTFCTVSDEWYKFFCMVLKARGTIFLTVSCSFNGRPVKKWMFSGSQSWSFTR